MIGRGDGKKEHAGKMGLSDGRESGSSWGASRFSSLWETFLSPCVQCLPDLQFLLEVILVVNTGQGMTPLGSLSCHPHRGILRADLGEPPPSPPSVMSLLAQAFAVEASPPGRHW